VTAGFASEAVEIVDKVFHIKLRRNEIVKAVEKSDAQLSAEN
jgi:hypothetical protein